MSHAVPQRGSEDGQTEILRMAAQCFMERGYAQTSIDDVARRLGSTKGRIYHFFGSKVDLFFAVARIGMDLNYAAVQPFMEMEASSAERLYAMAVAHALSMIVNRPYQRAVWEGVEIHLRGATTPEQRDRLTSLLGYRDSYSNMFRKVMEEARRDGHIRYPDLGIARQLMFVALNSPVFWYSPRKGETDEDRQGLARQCADYALRGLGASIVHERERQEQSK
jgi:AcrR family transcriptional regulator